MNEFLIQNIETLGALLAALIIIIYAIIAKQWALLRATAYSFMLSAERLMATEEGAKKMEAVFKATWDQIPKWIKVFISEAAFRTRLQEWYSIARERIAAK